MPLPQMKRGSGTVSGVYRVGSYTAMLIRDAESAGSIKYFFMLSVSAPDERTPTLVVTLEHNEMQGVLLHTAAQSMDEETRKALLANAPKSFLCVFDRSGGHQILEQFSQVLPEEQFRERAFAVVARQLGVTDPPLKLEREAPAQISPVRTAATRTISQSALASAYEGINHDLGDLGDLPRELATTVANVYYRFFLFSENPTMPTGPGFQPAASGSFIESYQKYMEGSATILSTFQFAKDLIKAARETRKQNARMFSYLVVLTLDVLKYNIENANEKTPIRRAIERKFKKVDEISNLLDLMAERGMVIYR